MDHNLEDSLNLESAMGSMDFDHSGVVVSQEDITLEASTHEEDMPMEFERIEEQPMLMDTGNEEIIVSDFMNDQYTLQEYSVQDAPSLEASQSVEPSNVLASQSESMIDLKFDSEASVSQEVAAQPQYIKVKAAVMPTRPSSKKNESSAVTSMPRQVAIAPKPPKLTKYGAGKQLAIAPKPVSFVMNKMTGTNKMLTGLIQSNVKKGTVLTQIGKQLVMVPAGAQKIKLVSSNSGTLQYVRTSSDQTQLISTKTVSGTTTQKPVIAKVIMQGAGQNLESNQPAVVTKLLSGSTSTSQAHYVMQQKTVPISIGGNKVILTSPTKSGMKIGKKQIIAIKSPTPKLMPVTSQGATKKIVITTNPSQNVILKTTAPPKSSQVTKDGNILVQNQRSQLHQINVPGKGIQYIRLITNSSPAPLKVTPKTQMPALAVPSKGFVLTDSKGNLIQMSADKLTTGQPPPLIFTSNIANKMTTKPQKKLVRIAPVAAKPVQPATQQQNSRGTQSLLAPLSPTDEDKGEGDSLDRGSMSQEVEETVADDSVEVDDHHDHVEAKVEQTPDFEDAVPDDATDGMHEVEVDYERHESPDDEEGNSMEQHDSSERLEEHPLIVIPSNFVKQESQVRVTSESSRLDESHDYSNIENDIMTPYLSPKHSQSVSESEQMTGELDGLRPRRACNCTKSQCLKLYCDCFANGEFCNQCNCNNCHNNLENEELRQKAIRACLDRNPNAFRPKIGKTKSAGPDIIRRHNKGCNCKRSGCLKNYCECYEAKIACTGMCKCVGCRNVEDTLERRAALRRPHATARAAAPPAHHALPRFMTSEVIEAVCQCLIAAAVESGERAPPLEKVAADPVRDVIDEFARCLQDIISASHHSAALPILDEGQA